MNDEVKGLLLAVDLAINEAMKKLAAPIAGSHKDKARIQLASASASVEMARYHIDQMGVEDKKA